MKEHPFFRGLNFALLRSFRSSVVHPAVAARAVAVRMQAVAWEGEGRR
jgi:hypothetical protein